MEVTEKEELKKLLKKYPFLIHRNVFSGEACYQTEEENLKYNWYNEWNDYGWEKIWKRFMQELFKEYDKLPDEAKFISSSFMGYGLYKDFVHTKKELNFKQS